jgi:galactokinase
MSQSMIVPMIVVLRTEGNGVIVFGDELAGRLPSLRMTSFIGEAPGRLDFMGGVADYSGSLVLQVATSVTTRVVATVEPTATGEVPCAILVSAAFGELRLPLSPVAALVASGAGCMPASLRIVRAALEAASAPRWAFYVFGSLAAFALEAHWLPPGGASLRLSLSSSVPLAQGVSSSASVEVATLRAVGAAAGAPLAPLRAAHVAQAAENHVVGAPCGLMDQLASSLGSPRRVLPILCRPDGVEALAALPAGAAVVGWPSGVEHSVAGSPYGVARAATFMAKRVLEARRAVAAPLACITQLAPSELEAVAGELPEAITGAEFAARFGATDDPLSEVNAGTTYGLRAAARFPVGENFRCARRAARSLQRTAHNSPKTRYVPLPPPPLPHTHTQ